MKPLYIEMSQRMTGIDTMKVTGFEPAELNELAGMEYREMVEKAVEILDSRAHKIGTRWYCGYGIYGCRVFKGALYVDIGQTSD